MLHIGCHYGCISGRNSPGFPANNQFKSSFQYIDDLFVYMIVLRKNGAFIYSNWSKGQVSGMDPHRMKYGKQDALGKAAGFNEDHRISVVLHFMLTQELTRYAKHN